MRPRDDRDGRSEDPYVSWFEIRFGPPQPEPKERVYVRRLESWEKALLTYFRTGEQPN